MNKQLKLPVGIDSFEEIRKSEFYYVDKTRLVEQLLENWGAVNLFTRPRRFGKTLNMSMLKCFFEIGTDRTLFDGLYIAENALKSNPFLKFAVLTGCLRVSKESIFTGMNNFKVLSITDPRFDEQFCFTEAEVSQLLTAYHLEENLPEIKEWYDGYRFGDADVYCPWDVINYVDLLRYDAQAKPQAYWINTSSNTLVKRFVDKADKSTRDELERLVAGEQIEKHLRLDLIYDEIDNSTENLWSVLFTTGYLTQAGMTEDGAYKLIIPNAEIREVYKLQIQDWFKRTVFANTEQLELFWQSLAKGDAKAVERYLNKTLSNTISLFDIKGQAKDRENSYHLFLAGLLIGNAEWLVRSNREAGDGFADIADIIVETDDPDAGLVIELKSVSGITELDSACARALQQIHERHYDEYLRDEGREDIWVYGIAFYKKRCRVMAERVEG